jgi:hypothetical protein
MAENGAGKWQLAFWIMTAVCFSGLAFIGNSVSANERINSAEHKELRECIYNQLMVINCRLARIEAHNNLDGK